MHFRQKQLLLSGTKDSKQTVSGENDSNAYVYI